MLPSAQAILGRIPGIVTATFGALASALVILVVGLHTAFRPTPYVNGFARLFPKRRERVRTLLGEIGHMLRRWIVGQLISIAAVGVLSYLDYNLLFRWFVGLGHRQARIDRNTPRGARTLYSRQITKPFQKLQQGSQGQQTGQSDQGGDGQVLQQVSSEQLKQILNRLALDELAPSTLRAMCSATFAHDPAVRTVGHRTRPRLSQG